MADRPQNESRPADLKQLALEVLRTDTEISAAKHSIQRIASDVHQLSLDVQQEHMDRKWTFDESGVRYLKDPRSEAWRIAHQLSANPDLVPDVIRSLNKKLNQRKIETGQLKGKCTPG